MFRHFSHGNSWVPRQLRPLRPNRGVPRSGSDLVLHLDAWSSGSIGSSAALAQKPPSAASQGGGGHDLPSGKLNIAIGNGPFIVDFPIQTWWFSIAMLNYQRVRVFSVGGITHLVKWEISRIQYMEVLYHSKSYKAIFCGGIPWNLGLKNRPEKYALYMVGTSNLGSWNDHWLGVFHGVSWV